MHSMLKYEVCLNHFQAAYTDFSPHPHSPSSSSPYSALLQSPLVYMQVIYYAWEMCVF